MKKSKYAKTLLSVAAALSITSCGMFEIPTSSSDKGKDSSDYSLDSNYSETSIPDKGEYVNITKTSTNVKGETITDATIKHIINSLAVDALADDYYEELKQTESGARVLQQIKNAVNQCKTTNNNLTKLADVAHEFAAWIRDAVYNDNYLATEGRAEFTKKYTELLIPTILSYSEDEFAEMFAAFFLTNEVITSYYSNGYYDEWRGPSSTEEYNRMLSQFAGYPDVCEYIETIGINSLEYEEIPVDFDLSSVINHDNAIIIGRLAYKLVNASKNLSFSACEFVMDVHIANYGGECEDLYNPKYYTNKYDFTQIGREFAMLMREVSLDDESIYKLIDIVTKSAQLYYDTEVDAMQCSSNYSLDITYSEALLKDIKNFVSKFTADEIRAAWNLQINFLSSISKSDANTMIDRLLNGSEENPGKSLTAVYDRAYAKLSTDDKDRLSSFTDKLGLPYDALYRTVSGWGKLDFSKEDSWDAFNQSFEEVCMDLCSSISDKLVNDGERVEVYANFPEIAKNSNLSNQEYREYIRVEQNGEERDFALTIKQAFDTSKEGNTSAILVVTTPNGEDHELLVGTRVRNPRLFVESFDIRAEDMYLSSGSLLDAISYTPSFEGDRVSYANGCRVIPTSTNSSEIISKNIREGSLYIHDETGSKFLNSKNAAYALNSGTITILPIDLTTSGYHYLCTKIETIYGTYYLFEKFYTYSQSDVVEKEEYYCESKVSIVQGGEYAGALVSCSENKSVLDASGNIIVEFGNCYNLYEYNNIINSSLVGTRTVSFNVNDKSFSCEVTVYPEGSESSSNLYDVSNRYVYAQGEEIEKPKVTAVFRKDGCDSFIDISGQCEINLISESSLAEPWMGCDWEIETPYGSTNTECQVVIEDEKTPSNPQILRQWGSIDGTFRAEFTSHEEAFDYAKFVSDDKYIYHCGYKSYEIGRYRIVDNAVEKRW